MNKKEEDEVCENTDREIYRQPSKKWTPDDGTDRGMEPTVFVTKGGGIGMNHYGRCAVKTIEEWVNLAWTKKKPQKL